MEGLARGVGNSRAGTMGTKFRPYQPDQILMLPPDLREGVSEGCLQGRLIAEQCIGIVMQELATEF